MSQPSRLYKVVVERVSDDEPFIWKMLAYDATDARMQAIHECCNRKPGGRGKTVLRVKGMWPWSATDQADEDLTSDGIEYEDEPPREAVPA